MELNIELLNRIKDEVFAEWLNSTDLDHYKHIVSSRPKKFDEITFEVRLYTLWPEVCRRYAEEVNKISFKDLQHDLNKDMTIKVLEQAISQLKKQNETLTNIISEGISKAAIKDETPKEVKPDFETAKTILFNNGINLHEFEHMFNDSVLQAMEEYKNQYVIPLQNEMSLRNDYYETKIEKLNRAITEYYRQWENDKAEIKDLESKLSNTSTESFDSGYKEGYNRASKEACDEIAKNYKPNRK